MDRREFLFQSTGAALGSFAVPGLAAASAAPASPAPAGADAPTRSALRTGSPVPLRHRELPGFLSAAQLAPHHEAHYGGALQAFVSAEERLEAGWSAGAATDPAAWATLKHLQSSRGNSVLLHELYFAGMTPGGGAAPPALRGAIERRFGSLERWMADFAASAKLAAGWAMLVVHPVNGRLYNVVSDEHAQGPMWLSAPLVVIDSYEHAFYIDYQNRKTAYVERFLEFIDWPLAERRYAEALA